MFIFSAGLPFTDIGGESIESFLDVKLDEDAKYNVKVRSSGIYYGNP